MSFHPYRKEVLEAIARRTILEYDPCLLCEPCAIPVELIIEKRFDLTLEYHYIRKNGRVLGETVFLDTSVPIFNAETQSYELTPVKGGTIIVDAGLLNSRSDGRLRYTCAHELAHWLIHKEIYCSSGETAAMTKTLRSSEADANMERQADRLSSYLLMPGGLVKKAFYSAACLPGDSINALSEQFGVSCQAMKIRLTEMRLVD